MGVLATAMEELIAAGLEGEALVRAVARIEDAMLPPRTTRQERNARYYANKRLKASESSNSDAPLPLKQKDPKPQKTQTLTSKNPPKGGQKGSRLPADWHPSESLRSYAEERGVTAEWLAREIERFRNHWLSKSGKDASKRDWDATWRNWILRAGELGPPKGLTITAPSLDHGAEVKGRVYVRQDTPQWDAWTVYRGRPPPTDRAGGWLMPSEWPPHQAAAE